MNNTTPKDIDDYIAQFPPEIKEVLNNIRKVIKNAAPDAVETISYQMPAFKLKGILVYFAAHKNHLGFYPTSSGIINFKEELSGYQLSKGTIKFPYDKPIPFELIDAIVKFRANENIVKDKIKSKRKTES